LVQVFPPETPIRGVHGVLPFAQNFPKTAALITSPGTEQEETTVPEWMVTYGDLMSLLLCFFIMLYAISTVQEFKMQAATESLRGGFGLFGQMTAHKEPIPKIRIAQHSAGESIGQSIRFEPGSDELTEPAKKELSRLHRNGIDVPNRILIMGCAGVNERGSYRREHDLAYARAVAVCDYLVSFGLNRDDCRLSQQTVGEDEEVMTKVEMLPKE
jgi:flagellar motor protein MotB